MEATSSPLLQDHPEKLTYTLSEVRNKVLWGDAFCVLDKLEPEIFDMVFLDPPYFLQLPARQLRRWKVKTPVDPVDDFWDKFESFAEYDGFITALLQKLRRVMKPQATIWAIATYHSIFRIGKVLQDLGYWILNDVIWVKTNRMPNWLGVRFTNATETLIWAVRDRLAKGYTFHREAAKRFGFGKTGSNVWVLPLCSGSERLKDEAGRKLHSTQKPLELLKRVLLTSTDEGDVVLDPMAGTGTTGYAAKLLGRHFVLIEKEEKYITGIRRRLSEPLLFTGA